MNASSGAVPTRLGKRKVGRRDSLLWDLIVNNNDDICFTHIIPRLNGTDLKFFYEVNEETRALIKRSSRKGDLKKGFRVREMSSISTLEVAWEHYPIKYDMWMDEPYMDEPCFCSRVAGTNKLELLKWAREEKQCEWDEETINVAALQGNMEMVKYCVANECPINEMACVSVCACAASKGHLEMLKYLHEEAKAPWDWRTAAWAADNGHLHILEYLVERKYDKFDEDACAYAAREGHLDCLKYLRETAKAPWNYLAVRDAHYYKTTRMFTIPPRQQLSTCTRLAIRTRNVIRLRGRRNTLALFYVFCSPFDGFFFKLHTISHEKKSTSSTFTHRKARS